MCSWRTVFACGAGLVMSAACDSGPTAPRVDLGQDFVLAPGERRQVARPSLTVRFVEVTGDSRCPAGTTCDEPGFATVELSVQTSLALNDVQAELPPEGTVEIVVEELTIEFLQLLPEAQEGVTIDLLDYRLGLRVTQTGDLGIPVQ